MSAPLRPPRGFLPVTPTGTPTLSLFAATLLLSSVQLVAQEQTAPPGFIVENVREIEVPGMHVSEPQWSPDGQWIAFSAPKANGIGIVRADGSGFRMLTSEPGSGYKFAWSPDGLHIAFRAARKDAGPRQYAIRVLDVATGEIESSTDAVKDAQPPMWQRGPDGARWVSHGAAGPLEGAWRGKDSPAARAAQLTPRLAARKRGERALNLAPAKDGTRIAFDTDDQIAVGVPEEPGAARKLCVGNHPAWSPDGQWLVFQITRDHSHAAEDPRQHTADTAPHLHDDKTNHRIVDSDLWIIAADGTGRQQLTHTPDVLEVEPDWSPDGARIVCRTEDNGRLRVLKIGRR